MRCKQCGTEETKVLESRLASDGRCIRRRRLCRKCQHRYTTYEREEESVLQIKKKNGLFEPFQKDKILHSIQVACRKRQVKVQDIEFIVGKIEQALQESQKGVLTSHDLGEQIMKYLYDLDRVAYVRFVSVYKDFKDTNEFYEILNSLKNETCISHELSSPL